MMEHAGHEPCPLLGKSTPHALAAQLHIVPDKQLVGIELTYTWNI